jgi:hypothetical protein
MSSKWSTGVVEPLAAPDNHHRRSKTMTPKIKGLGLAFVAITAMSMVAASGAQASAVHFGPLVSIFGERTVQDQTHQFTTSHGQVQCTQSLFEGKVSTSGAVDAEFTATYTGCLCFGLACTIDLNGCKYNLSGAGEAALTAKVQVTGCTAGKQIEITALNCVITVPEQTVGGHVFATNQTQQDVTIQATATGITYQSHGAGCPNPHAIPTTQTHNGTFQGQTTVQARQDLGDLALKTHNGHQYKPLNPAGPLKSLQAT